MHIYVIYMHSSVRVSEFIIYIYIYCIYMYIFHGLQIICFHQPRVKQMSTCADWPADTRAHTAVAVTH